MTAGDLIRCAMCPRTTHDPDKWDPEAATGITYCDRCWPNRPASGRRIIGTTDRGDIVLAASERLGGADVHLDVVEHAASRIDILVAFRDGTIYLGLTNFGKAAQLGAGAGADWRYVAEKLDLSDPDARAVAAVITWHEGA